jgi:predicted MFS family arabinose efflux permease
MSSKPEDQNPTSTTETTDETLASISKGRWRGAITVLLVVYILNFLDRQIVNILAEPIKQELGLADWQLGLLTGFAFALFYALAGIPIARLAEKANRRNIIGIAVGVWSAFTMLCGVATSYIQMLFFRFGVGVGEAGLVPPAHSLITDITPKSKRASAMAIFHLGLPLGTLLGLAFGGVVADAFGWRTAFVLAGAPGILAAILVFVVLPEPRSKLQQLSQRAQQKSAFGETLKCLLSKPAFVFSALAGTTIAFTSYSHQAFAPAYFFRVHGEELATLSAQFGLQPMSFLGLAFGLIVGVGGSCGLWLGGKLADSMAKTNRGNYCLVPAVALVIFFPVQVAAFLAPSLIWSLIAFIPANFLLSTWFAPMQATIQSVAPKTMRATASAITLLSINLIGLGLGPLLLGILSDSFAAILEIPSAEALTWALVVMTVFSLLASLFFFIARKHVNRNLED